MRTILMAILLCATAVTAVHATSQVPESLVYEGTTNDMYTAPLESLFPAGKPKVFVEKPSSTACWRGYVGTWEIKNSELYLVALQEGYPRTGAIPLDKVNPQWKSPVKAIWFSGSLRIGRGKLLMGGMGFSEKREVDIFFEIRDGKVVSTRTVDNTKEEEAAEPAGGAYVSPAAGDPSAHP